jgi:hypothetical protein
MQVQHLMTPGTRRVFVPDPTIETPRASRKPLHLRRADEPEPHCPALPLFSLGFVVLLFVVPLGLWKLGELVVAVFKYLN